MSKAENGKKVAIVLGGTKPHVNLIENLKCRNYYTILIDYLKNSPGIDAADEFICESTLDVDKVLKLVGLEKRKDNFPSQLSGGEQQRVSIARAIAKNPKLLLCDEPTGALDYKTGKQILKTLQDTCKNTGTTVIVITHNSAIAPIANKVIHINDAKVRKIEVNENPLPIEEIEW